MTRRAVRDDLVGVGCIHLLAGDCLGGCLRHLREWLSSDSSSSPSSAVVIIVTASASLSNSLTPF